MIELDRVNDEIFVARGTVVSLGAAESSFLKQQALSNPRRRARICVHRANEDPLHEMLIAIAPGSYIHPHKHLAKSESFHIVEGLVDVIIFDDSGSVTKIIKLGEPGSGRGFYYRLSESRFHTLRILSEILIMHEVTNGPFDKSQTVLAAFAPSEMDADATRNYMTRLSNEVDAMDPSVMIL